MANSLTTPTYTMLSEQLKDEHNITMLNPLSNDFSVMRQSLLFSGLEALSHNINRRNSDLKFFEFGKTYHDFGDKREEFKHLSFVITGNKTAEVWNTAKSETNFFYLKGMVNVVLERLGINRFNAKPITNDVFKEGLAYYQGKTEIVQFGEVKNSVLKHFGIAKSVFYADFNWDNIIEMAKRNKIKFAPIPKFPESRRDFALLLDSTTSFEDIYTIAKQTEKQLLKSVNLFDVYEGKNLPNGKKSYAVSFTFRDEHKTLTDKQVDKVMNKLQNNFESKLNAELR